MKPVKLVFNGINSFSEKTEIDFVSLSQNGLFGIFGDTGSGKSTILDCINFALYGNVERSKEKTDIINYRSDRAEVNFVFDILADGKRKRYTVERLIKRDKSGTHKAMLYENDGEKEVCIADKASAVEKKIVEILGVNAEDFRRCIALPQGEFSQFVKSAPRERLALIERLFALSKYGERLKDKISLRQEAIEREFQNVTGKLSAYENVNAETLEVSESELAERQKRLSDIIPAAEKCAKNYERLSSLLLKRKELEKIKADIAALETQKSEMEELRHMLSVLPACREVKQTADVTEKKRSDIEKYTNDLSEVAQRSEDCAKQIADIEKNIADGNRDKVCEELLKRSAEFKAVAGKPEKLRAILTELDKKRGEYVKTEEKFSALSKEKAIAEKELATAERNLAEKSSVDIQQLVGVKFKGAVLRGEYAATLDYFARLYGNVNELKDDSPLYEYISGELKAKIEEYEGRLLDVKDFGGGAALQLEKLRQIDEGRNVAQRNLQIKKDALQKLLSAEERLLAEQKTIKNDGEKLRERAEELKAEISKVFEGDLDEFGLAFKRNEEELRKSGAEKRELAEKYEAVKISKNELDISSERLKILLQTAKTELKDAEDKLKNLLSGGGLNSVDNCICIIEKVAAYPDAEKTVNEYDGRVLSLNLRAVEIEKTKEIFTVTAEEVYAAAKKKSEYDETVKQLNADVAVKSENCRIIKSRLNEKREILKGFEKVEHERGLVAKLKELVKNNRFLEYIANEYLEDISASASATLIKLTDGRYFLTYKDNNFFVGDNYNCGALRGVNTLSGGETFLVSLSLALSLSQTICAKSMKSIEFFFLDEGFGTLDSTLVETVMSALEKLKNSHFTIGVISHVEELKHRIGCKITVNKATETHGSTLSFSY